MAKCWICLAVVLAVSGAPLRSVGAPPGDAGGEAAARAETRGEYLDRIERDIKDLGKRIEELRGKAEVLGGKARAEALKAIKELSAKKKKLEAEARELKRSGENVWHKLRAGVDSALEELRQGVEKLRSRLAPEKGERI